MGRKKPIRRVTIKPRRKDVVNLFAKLWEASDNPLKKDHQALFQRLVRGKKRKIEVKEEEKMTYEG
jgi:hypothetical protein